METGLRTLLVVFNQLNVYVSLYFSILARIDLDDLVKSLKNSCDAMGSSIQFFIEFHC